MDLSNFSSSKILLLEIHFLDIILSQHLPDWQENKT